MPHTRKGFIPKSARFRNCQNFPQQKLTVFWVHVHETVSQTAINKLIPLKHCRDQTDGQKVHRDTTGEKGAEKKGGDLLVLFKYSLHPVCLLFAYPVLSQHMQESAPHPIVPADLMSPSLLLSKCFIPIPPHPLVGKRDSGNGKSCISLQFCITFKTPLPSNNNRFERDIKNRENSLNSPLYGCIFASHLTNLSFRFKGLAISFKTMEKFISKIDASSDVPIRKSCTSFSMLRQGRGIKGSHCPQSKCVLGVLPLLLMLTLRKTRHVKDH